MHVFFPTLASVHVRKSLLSASLQFLKHFGNHRSKLPNNWYQKKGKKVFRVLNMDDPQIQNSLTPLRLAVKEQVRDPYRIHYFVNFRLVFILPIYCEVIDMK